MCFSRASSSRRLAGTSKKAPELGSSMLQLVKFPFQFFDHVFSLQGTITLHNPRLIQKTIQPWLPLFQSVGSIGSNPHTHDSCRDQHTQPSKYVAVRRVERLARKITEMTAQNLRAVQGKLLHDTALRIDH